MTPEDESELHRLTNMLSEIEATLPECSPLREALQKAGYAISYSFMDGRRSQMENIYDNVEAELTDEEREHLRSMGIDPDTDVGG